MDRLILVSAGDAITAKLVEDAGFGGIWVSGFEASARLGLPDNGSITMTEMLNIAKPIVEAVKIPVWVDVDTGYGNFPRTVREFENSGIAGLCVEDNIPGIKINSLWGGKIKLMDAGEFAEKITLPDRKIKIIARTEALIRGLTYKEAMERCDLYRAAGADFVLPHARRDIQLQPWKRNYPAAIVPTKFPFRTNEELHRCGYSMIIWANQTERVKIKAIRDALESIKIHDCAADVELNLSATLDEMKGLTPNV